MKAAASEGKLHESGHVPLYRKRESMITGKSDPFVDSSRNFHVGGSSPYATNNRDDVRRTVNSSLRFFSARFLCVARHRICATFIVPMRGGFGFSDHKNVSSSGS